MDEYAEQQAHPELIAALHQHLVDRYLELAQALQPVAWHRDTCATWFFTTHPVPFCNGVVRTECSVTEIDPLITRITQEAQRRLVPLLWLLGPTSQPVDLPQWLERHGVRHDETISGMILDVQDLPAEALEPREGCVFDDGFGEAAHSECLVVGLGACSLSFRTPA